MNNFVVILLSLILSLALTIITFALGEFSPDWLYLTVIYWILAVPNSIGLIAAWFIGLLADVAFGSILGSNTLTFVVISFIIIKSYKFIRYLTVYQQSLIIFILLVLKQTILMWIDGSVGVQISSFSAYYWSTFTSAIAWPLVFFTLRYVRRKYNVS